MAMATTIGMTEVRERCEALLAEFEAWQQSDLQAMSEALFQHLSALEECDAEPETISDKRLLIEVHTAIREFRKWRDQVSQDPHSPYQETGHRDLWLSVERIGPAMEEFEVEKLPTIEYLRSTRPTPVSDAQIAKMYGFRLPGGQADIARLTHEARKQKDPAYLTDNPASIKEAERIEAEYTAIEQEIRSQREARENEPQMAIPTLDELIIQKVSVKQILKIRKQETRASVLSRAGQLRIMLPDETNPLAYGAEVVAAKRDEERRFAENSDLADQQQAAEVPDFGELGDKELRVIAMHEKGLKPGQIAKKLGTDYPGITAAAVSAIVARNVPPVTNGEAAEPADNG